MGIIRSIKEVWTDFILGLAAYYCDGCEVYLRRYYMERNEKFYCRYCADKIIQCDKEDGNN